MPAQPGHPSVGGAMSTSDGFGHPLGMKRRVLRSSWPCSPAGMKRRVLRSSWPCSPAGMLAYWLTGSKVKGVAFPCDRPRGLCLSLLYIWTSVLSCSSSLVWHANKNSLVVKPYFEDEKNAVASADKNYVFCVCVCVCGNDSGTRIRWRQQRKRRSSSKTTAARSCPTTTTVQARDASAWLWTWADSGTRPSWGRWPGFQTRCSVIQLNAGCTGTDSDRSSSSIDTDQLSRHARYVTLR